MKVTIFYDGDYSDQIIFDCDNIQEAKEIAYFECTKRGWNPNNCYSEVER